MPRLVACPRGHEWETLTEPGLPGDVCPVCGDVAVAPTVGYQVPTVSHQIPTAATETTVAASLGPGQRTPQPSLADASTAPNFPHIAGYEILGELGRGGMGVVYRARQASLKRLVALKMIRSGDGAASDELARFRAEAEAVARLQHPNIVQVYEIGSQDGRPYFSLEYVDGGSLDRKLAGRALPPLEAARLLESLSRAMHYAHQRGVVHRDLKPANILLSDECRVMSDASKPTPDTHDSSPITHHFVPKITDFGLAKQLDTDSVRTRSGAILGTPSYMAPEQAEGNSRGVGPLTDVYALGAILYEALTGRPPFRGATTLETIQMVLRDDPVRPTHLQAEVPRDLETICLKALAKEPSQRYLSALALAEDLGRFQAGDAIVARPERLLPRLRRKFRRHRVPTLALAAVVLVGVAAAFLIWANVTRGRNLTGLTQKLQTALDHPELDERYLADAEAVLDELAALDSAQATTLRQRLYELYGNHFTQSLKVPKLREEEVARFERALLLLENRSPQRVPELRRTLEARKVQWQPLIDVAAPYTQPDEVFTAGSVVVQSGSLRPAADSAAAGSAAEPVAVVYTRIPTPPHIHLDATFGPGWGAGSHIGLRLQALPGHEDNVWGLALSRDGKTLVSFGLPGIKVWDRAAGTVRASWDHPALVSRRASLSPDGSRLALCLPDRVSLVNTASLRQEQALPDSGSLHSIAFSANGKYLAGGDPAGKLRLWDAASGKLVNSAEAHHSRLGNLMFSPVDESLLVTTGWDGATKAWQVPALTGRTLHEDQPRTMAIGAAFSPDGKFLAYGNFEGDQRIRLRHLASGNERILPLKTSGAVDAVAFSPDGKMLAVAGFTEVILCHPVTGEIRSRLPLPWARALAFSGDASRLYVGDWTGSIREVQLGTGQVLSVLGKRAYSFQVSLPAGRAPRKEAKTLDEACAAGSDVFLEISRDGGLLRSTKIPAGALKGGNLHLRVEREGSRLSFTVNTLVPVLFEEVFDVSGPEGGTNMP